MMRLKISRIVAPLVAVAVLAAVGLAATRPALSADAPTAMLIVDGSGSMWGRLAPANRPKIDVVRDKLGALLTEPSSTRVGLISFGHRRRGDCNDVEMIAGPDSPRQSVLDPLSKLSPRGPGPVTAALRMAADAIGSSRPAQIVIVGDNADNCRQDSCAAARAIAKSSPGVVIQVIGIGLSANERPRMACMAEATGGRFYDIADSNGLDAAIEEAVKLAVLSPSDVAGGEAKSVAPKAPPPPAGASLRASAALAEGRPLITAPLTWRIYKAGGAKALGQGVGKDISAKLPAGDYDIEAELGGVKARHTITIADGEAQSIIVSLNAAHLLARAVASKNGPPSPTATLSVSSNGQPVALKRGDTVDLYLQPAEYGVTAVDGAARSSQTINLAAGDDKRLDVALSTGRLDLSATGANGGAIQDVLYTVETDDPESPDGRREVARSRSPQASFVLPEGTYYIGANSGNGLTSKRVAIGAGQTVTETLAIALVPVKITALVAGVPAKPDDNIFYRVDRIDGDRVSIARAIGPALDLSLSPGRYRISASLATAHLSASKEVTLDAGKPAKAVIDIASGQVNFVPTAAAVPAFGDLTWEVANENGMPIWRATGTQATAILAPGKYTVRFDARNSHGQAAFEVRAGQSQKLEIGPG
ncbi:VWA domain-containing protein [Hyphomicrobium sp. MC1]|uniref:vWA domain-containing protein n=1 Tax=Hyphomicrobium sp. (strain MC1) TaxID=717785 RepID=UPI000213D5C8|nr:VWA domain-containing protein [Hyphomicrobium sp. MC1]CCB65640.1 von Willebrand factor type A [Hyphomicrobium sp. MC1]